MINWVTEKSWVAPIFGSSLNLNQVNSYHGNYLKNNSFLTELG